MKRRSILAAAAMALSLCASQTAHAECKLGLLVTIPITFVNNEPMVSVTIDGKPANLRFSLGGDIFFWGSMLRDYGQREIAGTAMGMAVTLGGGKAEVRGVQIHELKIGDTIYKDKYFLILDRVEKAGEAGIFGTSTFAKNDIELDFAHNAVRIFKPDNCKNEDVVYWGGTYSVAERKKDGYYTFDLDGKALKGTLGAGNEVTFVTPTGASHAGVTSQAAGALPMAMVAGGLIKPVDVSIANFPELVIGDETIKNIPLAVADIYPGLKDASRAPDVILGGDFIQSHRIYISNEQKKIYFSYVGGVMFQDIYKRLGAERIPAPPQTPKP
jgi:hypothetical protein